ncbi:MAG: GTP-binding protein [Candidatus Lokiarchaeota archaeon]|nr:GTP-binding protein [Candidatus Lokiarchaeota archaeon]
MTEEYDYLFKSIVVGDGGVGKTAMTLRFSKGFFTEDYKMTIGVDFHVRTINVDTDEEQIRAKLQIWDTGGQERFSSIRPMYYRGALGALLMFDLTSLPSFEHLPQWIEEVRANVQNEVPVLLVGNKCDLVEQRAITLEEIDTFTRDFNLYYMEASAKTGDNVGDCFQILACLMIGNGVPEKLVSEGNVFAPGQILTSTVMGQQPTSNGINDQYSSSETSIPMTSEYNSFEPEQETEYNLSQESEYSPPQENIIVPEENITYSSETIQNQPEIYQPPLYKTEAEKIKEDLRSLMGEEKEPEVPIPEMPKEESKTIPDFEFKTQDEILLDPSQRINETYDVPSFSVSSQTIPSESFKPKAIPFSSNAPVPTTAPEDFVSENTVGVNESSIEKAPPFVFDQPSESVGSSEEPSNSLFDYIPEPIEKPKKAKKKAKKQKKDKNKPEKVKKEKEKKEKKETTKIKTPIEESIPQEIKQEEKLPSLFETLYKKTAIYQEEDQRQQAAFVPFSKTQTANSDSNAGIIPNIEDFNNDISNYPSYASSLQSIPSNREKIVCSNCGSKLSSEYAFCNKCGSKLD